MHYITIATFGGFLFATWQLMAKTSSNTPMVLNLGMIAGGFFASTLYGYFVMKPAEWRSVVSSDIWLPLLCGALNGAGFILYLTAMQKSTSIVTVSMTSMMTMIGFIAIGSMIFFGDRLTWEKSLGVCAAVLAVYLLSK